MVSGDLSFQADYLGYSLRRYFVDEFHFRHVPMLPAGSRVLDLGGNKILKRGRFDIECYDLRVVYANLSTAKQPDLQSDAAHVPFRDSCFDAVICSELLEHVPNPLIVLHEAHRVLRVPGVLLICVPFLFRLHGDPYDYGRYTPRYWEENLTRIGFSDVEIERQGLFWSVLVEMLRSLAHEMFQQERPRSAWMRRLVAKVISLGQQKALAWDIQCEEQQDSFFTSFSTGFGIRTIKSVER